VSVLAGKVIVVTGASSGIGEALCLALAGEGARIVAAARQTEPLEAVAEACRRRGAPSLAVATDVGEAAACEGLVKAALERFGAIDAIVNNAGIEMIARFDEIRDVQLFERLMRVNYLGAVYLTFFALPALKRARGRIVAISSLAGLTGVPTRTAYAATKHALFGFYDSLRIELAGSGISVTVVAPDYVRTELRRRAAGPDGAPLGISPLREARLMTAERCATEFVRAMKRRQRQRLLSMRGRLGLLVRPFVPSLIDAAAARAVRRGD
jgi:NAD(P)-dependent dehydrogenase (short-subunit alcohol dehydrogenase family)